MEKIRTLKSVEQFEFKWSPRDANKSISFEIADGQGLVTGNKVELWFTVKYPMRELPTYAQINGWDALFNPFSNMNAAGIVSANPVPANAKMVADGCTAMVDRIAVKCKGQVMTISDIQGQYLNGYITWLIG